MTELHAWIVTPLGGANHRRTEGDAGIVGSRQNREPANLTAVQDRTVELAIHGDATRKADILATGQAYGSLYDLDGRLLEEILRRERDVAMEIGEFGVAAAGRSE
jgi:hypothetical protein